MAKLYIRRHMLVYYQVFKYIICAPLDLINALPFLRCRFDVDGDLVRVLLDAVCKAVHLHRHARHKVPQLAGSLKQGQMS